MLCVLKKSSKLQTVFDLYMQNDNTEKGHVLLSDQDTIQHDVAHAPYRFKLDMLEAYEQICIKSEDVPKTSFSTIFGTFMSQVMQQGDCNAPSTFQQMMTVVFNKFITHLVHVYLDDIFVFSSTIEEHEVHLMQEFNKLHKAQLYLS